MEPRVAVIVGRVLCVAAFLSAATPLVAQESLQNPGFETGDLASWERGAYPGTANVGIISPAKRTGNVGAWTYTAGDAPTNVHSFSELYQDVPAVQPGRRARGAGRHRRAKSAEAGSPARTRWCASPTCPPIERASSKASRARA